MTKVRVSGLSSSKSTLSIACGPALTSVKLSASHAIVTSLAPTATSLIAQFSIVPLPVIALSYRRLVCT